MTTAGSKHERPTIGILAGWSARESVVPDHYLSTILQGIQSAAHIRGCHLMLAWGVGRVTADATVFPAWPEVSADTDFVPVGPWNTDGLIVFSPLRSEARSVYLRGLIAGGFPVLFIATGEEGPAVAVDNERGIRQAVAHLVDHGHRRIAFIAGQPSDKGDSAARLQAFEAAMREHKLRVEPRLVKHGWHTLPGGYRVMQDLLASGTKFAAVLASNDNCAIGAMQAAREAGLRIPRDLAIVGFDDQPDAAAQTPPLTTVHAPLAAMGEQALVMILDHLIKHTPLESVRVPPRLVRRRSCGCMPEAVATAMDTTRLPPPVAEVPARMGAVGIRKEAQRLVTGMLALLPSELRFPVEAQYRLICRTLVGAFYRSLKADDPALFQPALAEFLDVLERTGSMAPWQEMISLLRREMKGLPLPWERVATVQLAENLLHQARAAVSEVAEREDRRHEYQRVIAGKALSELTARLSATLDEHLAVRLLEDHLTEVGIQHARVLLFECDKSDPVAWSVLLNTGRKTESTKRFPSRGFPPRGLYPPKDLLDIALFPLVFQEEALGYVAFDTGNLESCSIIATQLAATIKASRLHRQVTDLSLTDSLTGLHNRRYFDLFLRSEIARHQRFARGLALVFMDVDRFKEYNDTFGHPAGDEALRVIGSCLDRNRRSSDMAARLGGDEFVLILPETDATGARKVAQRVRAALAGRTELQQPITLSFGITVPDVMPIDAQTLVRQADKALYRAKHSGRDRIAIFGGRGTGRSSLDRG